MKKLFMLLCLATSPAFACVDCYKDVCDLDKTAREEFFHKNLVIGSENNPDYWKNVGKMEAFNEMLCIIAKKHLSQEKQ